jgi:hypothetical protein
MNVILLIFRIQNMNYIVLCKESAELNKLCLHVGPLTHVVHILQRVVKTSVFAPSSMSTAPFVLWLHLYHLCSSVFKKQLAGHA